MTPDNQPQSAPAEREIRVLLVDDHAIWRDGVRSILEGTEFHVVGEAASGKEGVAAAGVLQPQIVLLDIRMAGGDGLEALRTLKERHPQTAVVMLTSYENPTYLARAVAGGASGYLLKGLKRVELMTALRAIAEGEMLLSREDLARSLRVLNQSLSEATAVAQNLVQPLSEREVDVLRLLATGLGNREIGELLFITENTVKTHVVHIIGKLGVSDRVQAAVWAARHWD
jgi:DNA-binding NarL/FixJ family response regulator